MLHQFWRKIWGICLLKVGPEELPASQALFVIAVLLYFTASFVIGMLNLGFLKSVASAAVDTGLLLAASYIMVWVKLTPNRWQQTATAMAGTSAVLGAIALPAAALQVALGAESAAVVLPALILIALMVWNLIIFAHIFKSALEINMYIAAALSGFYMYLTVKVMNILFFTAT